MTKRAYCGGFEVVPTSKNNVFDGAIGGFVYCFVCERSLRAALDAMENALAEDHYKIRLAEFVRVYDAMDWDDQEAQEKHDMLAQKALSEDDVFYGTFYTYTEEEEFSSSSSRS